MTQQIILLYETAQTSSRSDFLAALELAAEQHMYGAEYIVAILSSPRMAVPHVQAESRLCFQLGAVPKQQEIERDLAQYEEYVANRESMQALLGGRS
jgi:hypothetical protein